MERYRILDHAADAKLRAFGATLEEAFGNAALGMASLVTDWEKVERRVVHEVAVEGRDPEQLLVKLLSEVLYLSDAKAFVLGGAEVGPIEDAGEAAGPARYKLRAKLLGDDRPERYELHGDVKAVTYSEIRVESCACGPGPWMVQVVLDI